MADEDYTLGEVITFTRKAVDKWLPSDETYAANEKALRHVRGDIMFAAMDGCCRPLSELSDLSREEKSDLLHIVVKLRVGPLYKPWIVSSQELCALEDLQATSVIFMSHLIAHNDRSRRRCSF